MTFGMGLGGGNNTDGIDQVGAMFHAFGANLIDVEGTLHLDSPEVHAVSGICAETGEVPAG